MVAHGQVASRPYDVVVIGAGVVGAGVTWELSHDRLRVLWLEACYDVCEGASKGTSAIVLSGADTQPGTLETQLIRASSRRWEAICADLDVPFRRVGSLTLAFTPEEETRLEELHLQAKANGAASEIVRGGAVHDLAAAASQDALAALHRPDEGIIDPFRLTVGYSEVAVRNGVDLMLSTPATGFRRNRVGALTHVETPRGTFPVGAVVNAAGLHAGKISAAAGAESFHIRPRKGQFLLVDREVGRHVTKILASLPTVRTRGVLAIPTTNATLLLGPTAEDIDDPGDLSTDEDTLERALVQGLRLVAGIERRHIIKTFAGLRPLSDRGYRVERSECVPNLVHAAALRSGVSSSPSVATRVRALLAEIGVSAPPRPLSHRQLASVPRLAELDADEILQLASKDEGYRTVVCACEHVSAAEIRAALNSDVPARSIDGVRKRTRACAGRCQGAYCSAGVGFMLSIAHRLAPWEVPQGDPGSTWGIGEA